ncbi:MULTISPECIES: hypothetical protein [Oceanimonas]|uniref:Uncharacterized protein n=1 Tax=Oceanimonas smirnovii TaxID=264574 RepID=A0ABW7NYN9_9GAMM|nr:MULTISPECIES: hypothetical protein [Oceanimonas]MDV2857453.1 hypothetical protein [Oceanimonas sp. CAM02]
MQDNISLTDIAAAVTEFEKTLTLPKAAAMRQRIFTIIRPGCSLGC